MFRPGIAPMIAAVALCAPAHAQNALGDGRGLDNNDISVTRFNRRANAGESLLDRIRLRNAIVTGNAPGGLSFRGDLGYGAPREFRGELGANDLFAFRRDSLYSGLSGYGIRGTEAMQWQFALTTGAQAPSGLLGSPRVYRFGTQDLRRERDLGRGVPALQDSDLRRPDPIESEIRAMRAPGGTLLGSLRSTSAYTTARSSNPTLLVSGTSSTGQRFGVTASGLEGVRMKELELPAWMIGDAGLPITATSENRINPQSTSERVTATRTAYDEVLDRLRTNTTPALAGTSDPMKPAWQQRLDEIRDMLAPSWPGAPADDDDESIGFSRDALDLIRGAGGEADSLIVGESAGFDPYADHVRRAQDLLGAGRYFDAEERFTRALSIRRGDVAAQVGRVHAQLGAGMYLSASINLRSLVGANPEITGVRYGARLLPTGERLTDIVRVLRDNAEREDTGTLQHESALLLAYIGAQTGDRSMILEGLDTFEIRASPSDKRLIGLLRGVWLAPMNPTGPDDPGR